MLMHCGLVDYNDEEALFPLFVLQELQALIQYIQMNKESDTDWFTIAPSEGGKKWSGKCW
jgi:hypothetical protein